jgi:hypothetical protein
MAIRNRNPLFDRAQPGGVHAYVNEAIFPGAVFFVDSTHAAKSDSEGAGFSPDAPFATLDYAIGQCTASKGDVIFVMPGHAENVTAASGITLDVAGIKVIGIGHGALRPTFTFTTATTATIVISAASVYLENLIFKNGIDALEKMLSITGADCTLQGCEVRDNNASFQVTDAIVTTAAADRLRILDHVHRANGGKTGAATHIKIVGGNDHIIIPRWMDGDVSTAIIQNVTTACDNLQIFGRGDFPAYMRTRNSADVIVTCVATTKGRVGPNINARLQDNAANITEAFVGAAMEFFQPINEVNADGESSMQTNITASTDA